MTVIRPFRNTDPPQLAEVWRSQPQQRSLVQPLSASLFETLVVAQPTFDRQGLLVADDAGRLLGFAHAGFGPTADGQSLSTALGATSLVLVRQGAADLPLALELLARAEEYLRRQGAATLFGGAVRPLAPFYQGLYGGSELLGVLDSDAASRALYPAAGYESLERTVVLQRRLADFRPPVDRRQMQVRRAMQVQMRADPVPRSWWEACTYGHFDRWQFQLLPRGSAAPLASVMLWNMEAFSATWGLRTVGLVDLEMAPGQRRQGMATYLVADVLRQLHEQGVALVEATVRESNSIALALFSKLGFERVDAGTIYRKC